MASTINASTTLGLISTADTSGVLQLQTANTTAVTVDASQNVTFVGSQTLSAGTANGVTYLNGSKVLTSGSALVFDGTNLGVGANITASASSAPSFTVGTGSGSPAITLYSATNLQSQISFADATTGSGAYDGYILYDQSSQYMAFGRAASEAMRLTSTGLGIGTSSPAGKLTVKTGTNENLSVVTGGSGDMRISALNDAASDTTQLSIQGSPLLFRGSGGAERARIDSSGNLLVGLTSTVLSSKILSSFNGATQNGIVLDDPNSTSAAGFIAMSIGNGTYCGSVSRVGSTSAVVYTATSDRRLKENIVDAPSALAHINSVKVRSFNWIDGGHQIKYGVIAQEFFDVEPDAVIQGDSGETIEKTWSVDTSALVPAMIKAMQEQQAIIESLKARLDAANL
jgi:hypothetical protein